MYFELFCVKISEENSAIHSSFGQNEAEVHPLSAETVKAAAKAGLAAAAMKAKLFADHEEREIQRLSANIINHQVYFCLFHMHLFFQPYIPANMLNNCWLKES